MPAALIKGDARMAEVLRRAVWGHVGRPTEPLVVPRGAYQWRVGSYLAAEIVDELTQPRGALRGRPDDAAAAAGAPGAGADGGGRRLPRRPGAERGRPQPAREDVRGPLWPKVDPVKLVLRLLTDAEFLAAAAAGILTPEEQTADLDAASRLAASARHAGRWPT